MSAGSPRCRICAAARGSLDHDGTISEAASVALSAKPGTDGQRTAQIMCLARAVTAHLKSGHRDRAHELLERLEELVPKVKSNPAGARAWRHHARSAVAYFAGKPAEFRRELELAVEQFDLAGDARTSTNDRVNLGFVLITLGQLDRAEKLLLQVLSAATRLGLETVKTYSRHNLGLVRLWLGDAKGSVEYQQVAVEQAKEQGEAIPGRLGAGLSLVGTRGARPARLGARGSRASQGTAHCGAGPVALGRRCHCAGPCSRKGESLRPVPRVKVLPSSWKNTAARKTLKPSCT